MGVPKKRCEQDVLEHPWLLGFDLKTQNMCEKAVKLKEWILELVPVQYKTSEMCERAFDAYPWALKFVSDQ